MIESVYVVSVVLHMYAAKLPKQGTIHESRRGLPVTEIHCNGGLFFSHKHHGFFL